MGGGGDWLSHVFCLSHLRHCGTKGNTRHTTPCSCLQIQASLPQGVSFTASSFPPPTPIFHAQFISIPTTCRPSMSTQSQPHSTFPVSDMSEAPRLDLNREPSGFDIPREFKANGDASTSDLQNSAVKSKDSILESEVRGTERLPTAPRIMLTPYITVLSAPCTPSCFCNLTTAQQHSTPWQPQATTPQFRTQRTQS